MSSFVGAIGKAVGLDRAGPAAISLPAHALPDATASAGVPASMQTAITRTDPLSLTQAASERH